MNTDAPEGVKSKIIEEVPNPFPVQPLSVMEEMTHKTPDYGNARQQGFDGYDTDRSPAPDFDVDQDDQ